MVCRVLGAPGGPRRRRAGWPAGLRSDAAIPWSECRCTQRGCESRPTGLCR